MLASGRSLGALTVLLLGVAVACSSSSSANGGGAGTAGTAGTTGSGGSGASAGSGGSGATGGTGTAGAGGSAGTSGSGGSAGTGGATGSGRPFPDTSTKISIFADQLPSSMNAAQQKFVVTHYVGTQKLTLKLSKPLRALDPNFLVLHYHLAMWQSAPNVPFIIDGNNWGNDYPTVTTHESWFWHNTSGQRVASDVDGKLLMNVSVSGFQSYWASSIAKQVKAGDYDGVFLDSASPSLLQGEAKSPPDPRLAGTGVKTNTFPEMGGLTWIQAWEEWIKQLNGALAAQGIPLIPNTGPFVTTWDNTDYTLTAGIFSEGFASPSFAESDWKASTNEILKIVGMNKIVILQNYLGSTSDLHKRMYYLGNYLLVKGKRTYLDYFSQSPLEWYPEWGIDLGAAQKTAITVSDLLKNGVYERDFQKGIVLVNPSPNPVSVSLGATMKRVVPQGGGAVPAAGTAPGSITTQSVTNVTVAATSAEILLN